jgi:nucleoside diphosphate kinase
VHYHEHSKRPFFPSLVEMITSDVFFITSFYLISLSLSLRLVSLQ